MVNWISILTVNLQGIRKSGVILKRIGKASGKHFDCKFTGYPQVWGDFEVHWEGTGQAF